MHTHNGSKFDRSKTIVYYVYNTKNTIKTQLIYFKKNKFFFYVFDFDNYFGSVI